ncbi:SAM-dependent methyltransferase [Nocardia sp. NPDC005366]|uniref:SAM-dependent methyltransferase n=1 Tax=Nocardia sp. NPDC005366 TaxID=3156878 RepID=UPI0033A44E39
MGVEFELSGPTHPRVLDALLHEYPENKDNYGVDREVTAKLDARAPMFKAGVRAGRAFLLRAARELAEHGANQFVVIGCGYARDTNVHSVTRAVAPQARTVYLDSGAIVAVHGRAMLDRDSQFIEADPNDPAAILSAIDYRRSGVTGLDTTEPIALVFGSLMLERLDDPGRVIAELVDALPSGYLVATHIRADVEAATAKTAATVYAQHGLTLRPRTGGEIGALLGGVELLAPGLVVAGDWLPDQDTVPEVGGPRCCWGAVGTWGGVR